MLVLWWLLLGFTPHESWTIRETSLGTQVETCTACAQGKVLTQLDNGLFPNVYAIDNIGVMYHTGLSGGEGMHFESPAVTWSDSTPDITEVDGRRHEASATGTASGWTVSGSIQMEYTGSFYVSGTLTKVGDGTDSIIIDIPTQSNGTPRYCLSPQYGDSPLNERQQKDAIDDDCSTFSGTQTETWRSSVKLGGAKSAIQVYVADSTTDWCNGQNIGLGSLANPYSFIDESGKHTFRITMANACTFQDGDQFDFAIRVQPTPAKPTMADRRLKRFTSMSALDDVSTADDIEWFRIPVRSDELSLQWADLNYDDDAVAAWAQSIYPQQPVWYFAAQHLDQGDATGFANKSAWECGTGPGNSPNASQSPREMGQQREWFGENQYTGYWICALEAWLYKLASLSTIGTTANPPAGIYGDHADLGRQSWNEANTVWAAAGGAGDAIASGRGIAPVEGWWLLWEGLDRQFSGDIYAHNDTLPSPNTPFVDYTIIGEALAAGGILGDPVDYLNDGNLSMDWWKGMLWPVGSGGMALPQSKDKANEATAAAQIIGLGFVLDVPVWYSNMSDTTATVGDELAKYDAFGSFADDKVDVFVDEWCNEDTSGRCDDDAIIPSDPDLHCAVYDCTDGDCSTSRFDAMLVCLNEGTAIGTATVTLDPEQLGMNAPQAVNEACVNDTACASPAAFTTSVSFGSFAASPERPRDRLLPVHRAGWRVGCGRDLRPDGHAGDRRLDGHREPDGGERRRRRHKLRRHLLPRIGRLVRHDHGHGLQRVGGGCDADGRSARLHGGPERVHRRHGRRRHRQLPHRLHRG